MLVFEGCGVTGGRPGIVSQLSVVESKEDGSKLALINSVLNGFVFSFDKKTCQLQSISLSLVQLSLSLFFFGKKDYIIHKV